VVKQHYWGEKRGYRVLFDLGRCDDRQRRQEIREIVQDYQPLVHAKVVIKEIEDVSGPLQGKSFFNEDASKDFEVTGGSLWVEGKSIGNV
jgi:hypothetical protein